MIEEFYEKVTQRLENNQELDLNAFFWADVARRIRRGYEEMGKKSIQIKKDKLTIETVNDFYYSLYCPFIQERKNANVINLIEKYSDRILKWNDGLYGLYFAGLYNDEKMIAGGIFSLKSILGVGDLWQLVQRVDDSKSIFWKLRVWKFIEDIFFRWGKELNISVFSYWQDRNGYGGIWGNIGLALHKWENKFLPQLSKNQNIIRVNIEELKEPTLFFCNPDESWYFKSAMLIHSNGYNNIWVLESLLSKRGISLVLR